MLKCRKAPNGQKTAPARLKEDLIMKTLYYNAAVYTGELPLQEAFAVEDGRFVFAGSSAEGLAAGADEIVDLGGRFVCAGFNDSHMHMLNFGQALASAPLHLHTESLADMLDCRSPWKCWKPSVSVRGNADGTATVVCMLERTGILMIIR